MWPVPPRKSVVEMLRKGSKVNPTLRPFQREGVEFLRRHAYRAMILDAPGAGKTPQALTAAYEGRLTPTLVICPSSVAWNWRREAKWWAPGFKTHVIEGLASTIPTPTPNIVVCPWDLVHPHREALARAGFKLLVADEAHYAKNPLSQRGAAVADLCKIIPGVVLLSGTPLINNEEELEVLQDLLGKKNPPSIRRLLEDVAPDIPPKKRVILDVKISAGAMKEYRLAETEFAEYLEAELAAHAAEGVDTTQQAKRTLSAAALTKVGYLRRILGRAKALSAAAWIVQQIRSGEPVVVFAEHGDVLDALAETLAGAKVPFVRLDGSTPRKARQQAIDRFQSGEVSVFLGSQAAREGITLHRARHMLFVERWWTPAAEEQAEDRIRRIGQKHPTFVWFLQVPGTYDERMSEIVEAKRVLVRRKIGAYRIERVDATDLLGKWLLDHPDSASLELPVFPELPKGTHVHLIVFSARNWTPDTVRRWLKVHEYDFRSITLTTDKIRVELRSSAHFATGSFRAVRLGPDIGAILGKPRPVRKVARNWTRRRRVHRI